MQHQRELITVYQLVTMSMTLSALFSYFSYWKPFLALISRKQNTSELTFRYANNAGVSSYHSPS